MLLLLLLATAPAILLDIVVVVAAVKLAGVCCCCCCCWCCNLAELFKVPHVEEPSPIRDEFVEEPKDKLFGGAGPTFDMCDICSELGGEDIEDMLLLLCVCCSSVGGPGPMPIQGGGGCIFKVPDVDVGYFNIPGGIDVFDVVVVVFKPTSISSRVGMGNSGVLKVDVDEPGVDMFCTAVAAEGGGCCGGGIIPIVTYELGTLTYSPLEFNADDIVVSVHVEEGGGGGTIEYCCCCCCDDSIFMLPIVRQ